MRGMRSGRPLPAISCWPCCSSWDCWRNRCSSRCRARCCCWITGRCAAGRRTFQDGSRYCPASLRGLVLEKLPLMALAIPVMIATLRAQQPTMDTLVEFSLGERIGNTLVSYVRYLLMAFWPVDLALLYPRDAAALAADCRWYFAAQHHGRGRLGPQALALPGRGLAVVYRHAGPGDRIGADAPFARARGPLHLCGLYRAVHAGGLGGGGLVCARPRRAAGAAPVAASALACCLLLTWWQVDYWRNSEALWRHAACRHAQPRRRPCDARRGAERQGRAAGGRGAIPGRITAGPGQSRHARQPRRRTRVARSAR